MDEREAVARLRRGDIGDLEPLVRLYYVQAVRAAYLITRDRPMAEDVAQETFIRAYERIHQFDPARPFRPWLLRSVVNGAINAASRRDPPDRPAPHPDGEEDPLADMPADPAPGPTDLVERRELGEAVWQAMGELPAEQRAAIVMRYYLDLSEAEMARDLAVPPGTVKWRLHAARKRLRTLLKPLWLV